MFDDCPSTPFRCVKNSVLPTTTLLLLDDMPPVLVDESLDVDLSAVELIELLLDELLDDVGRSAVDESEELDDSDDGLGDELDEMLRSLLSLVLLTDVSLSDVVLFSDDSDVDDWLLVVNFWCVELSDDDDDPLEVSAA